MKKFDILPHTADGKFRAYGKTLEEKFSNALLAMFSFMFNTEKVKPKRKKEIKVKGKDESALLYNWLEEFLYFLDIESFIPCRVAKMRIIKKNKGFELIAIVFGDKVNEKYKSVGSVKAVTYAQMEITEKYVQVVVDL